MNISVDEGLKKKVKIKNRKNRRGIYNLWIFEKVSLFLVIIFSVMFPVYCMITGSYISTNMRTGENSYFLVAMLTSVFSGMGLVFVLLVSVLRKRIEDTLIGGRVDEKIEILEDNLYYTFRIEYQTLINQRNLVIFDLKKIRNISYDEKSSEIIVEGMMAEKIVGMSYDIHKMGTSEMVDSKIKIWDYFTPSLYEVLKSKISQEDGFYSN